MDDEVTALQAMLDGNHEYARAILRQLPKEKLQKLSDALDYYAALVDEQIIRMYKEQT